MYKLKISGRNIPISSRNGQNPDERQIEVIKNVLKDDFLANDDVTGVGEDQSFRSIAMDRAGNLAVVCEDYRYSLSNPDIIGQSYFNNGVANGVNYRIVTDGTNYGEASPVVAANNKTIVFSWTDNRRSKGWDIYAKIVGWDYPENNFSSGVYFYKP